MSLYDATTKVTNWTTGKYIIAGGTGFIGSAIVKSLLQSGNEVVVLTRGTARSGAPRLVHWDGISGGAWLKELENAAVVLNFAGRSINALHTTEIRREILDSRINSVRALADACAKVNSPPAIWFQASAVGFYGHRGDEILNEASPSASGILSDVTVEWEKSFEKTVLPNTRKIIGRLGVVFGREEGALPRLVKIVKSFAGGSAGSGRQFMSWIHIEDVVMAIAYLLQSGEGTYNLTAPTPVTNAELMKVLRKKFHRPWSPPAPAFAIRLGSRLIGVQPELILESTRAVPDKLLKQGYAFRYHNLKRALDNLLPRV